MNTFLFTLGIFLAISDMGHCQPINPNYQISLKVLPVMSYLERAIIEWDSLRLDENSSPVVFTKCNLRLNSTTKQGESKTDTLPFFVHFKHFSVTGLDPSTEYKIKLQCVDNKDKIWKSDIVSFTTGSGIKGKPSMREYLLASMGKFNPSVNTHLTVSREELVKNIAKLRSDILEWKKSSGKHPIS